MTLTESQIRQWLDQVQAGEISFSRMVEMINEKKSSLPESDFFSGLKEHYGLDIPKNERTAFCVSAGREISDLRWLLRLHPDQDMVIASCLHSLGDEAQLWWANRNKKKILPPSIVNGD